MAWADLDSHALMPLVTAQAHVYMHCVGADSTLVAWADLDSQTLERGSLSSSAGLWPGCVPHNVNSSVSAVQSLMIPPIAR